MSRRHARDLSTQEIGILLHLLRTGAGGHRPVLMLSGARQPAGELAKLGLIDIWFRQSIGRKRSEGPFYSLTPDGRERATALYLKRQSRQHIVNDLSVSLSGEYPPPHNLKESYNARP